MPDGDLRKRGGRDRDEGDNARPKDSRSGRRVPGAVVRPHVNHNMTSVAENKTKSENSYVCETMSECHTARAASVAAENRPTVHTASSHAAMSADSARESPTSRCRARAHRNIAP